MPTMSDMIHPEVPAEVGMMHRFGEEHAVRFRNMVFSTLGCFAKSIRIDDDSLGSFEFSYMGERYSIEHRTTTNEHGQYVDSIQSRRITPGKPEADLARFTFDIEGTVELGTSDELEHSRS